MRISDNRLGRFLSVDPLTKSYPGWTPYSFAMNRPIDGVDLDGEEWKRSVTYDIKTSFFTITYDIKIKIYNGSSIICGIENEVGSAIKANVESGLNNVVDKSRKINYKANLSYEVVQTPVNPRTEYGVNIGDEEGSDRVSITGMVQGERGDPNTQHNSVFAAATYTDANMKLIKRSTGDIAQTAWHEIVHSAGVTFHPFDKENTALDVDLTPFFYMIDGKRKFTYIPSPTSEFFRNYK